MDDTLLNTISILYVEDDSHIREEMVEVLEDECRNLYVATNGQEGLELFEAKRPDIVVTDIRMPQMDGLQMSRKILALDPDTPIVISSAFNESEYLLEAIKLGIHYYLLKPINLKELFETLQGVAQTILNARRLKKSEKLLNQYKEAVDRSDIVSKTDINGIITYANDAFCKISGYSREELLGSSHNIVRHPDTHTKVFTQLWSTILDKKEWRGVVKNRAKDLVLERSISLRSFLADSSAKPSRASRSSKLSR